MYFKKVAASLIILGIGGFIFLSFSQLRVKEAFADSIKQNVVYTKTDVLASDNNNDEAFKVKSSEALRKYFDKSPEANKDVYYYTVVLNEKGLNEWERDQLKVTQDEFEEKRISSEQYNKQKDDIKEQHEALKVVLSKLNHGVIQTTWFDGEKVYGVFFNENTKEVEFALGGKCKPQDKADVPLKASEEQLKKIAEDFIKKHKLGDIEKPRFIMFDGKNNHCLFYQEENDSTKKASITIDRYTNKVNSFAVKAYADMFYNEIMNEK